MALYSDVINFPVDEHVKIMWRSTFFFEWNLISFNTLIATGNKSDVNQDANISICILSKNL